MKLPATGHGRNVGACGELAQGFLDDGRPFHVTCPIDGYSEVELRLTPAARTAFVGFGEARERMRMACERLLAAWGCAPFEVALTHRSGLDVAKGMASSTADIAAAARALGDALGRPIGDAAIARLAASIERSDGVMYDGVNVVDHVTGDRIASVAWCPPLAILMCIPPTTFPTSSACIEEERRSKPDTASLLHLLERACAERDAGLFVQACTRSAELNERYRPNPLFRRIEPHLAELEAGGACVAHTGTVVGLLFSGTDARQCALAAVDRVGALFPPDVRLEVAALASQSHGGTSSASSHDPPVVDPRHRAR